MNAITIFSQEIGPFSFFVCKKKSFAQRILYRQGCSDPYMDTSHQDEKYVA